MSTVTTDHIPAVFFNRCYPANHYLSVLKVESNKDVVKRWGLFNKGGPINTAKFKEAVINRFLLRIFIIQNTFLG